MNGSELSTNLVKWNKGLSNWVSIVIRSHIDHTRLVAYMTVIIFLYVFCSVLYHFTYGCMFCMLLPNVVQYVY